MPLGKYLHDLGHQKPGVFADTVHKLLDAKDPSEQSKHVRELVSLEDGGWGLEGLLRNTFVVTMINSGVKPNVIPGSAEAVMNARLLPGNTVDDFVQEMTRVIGDPRIRIEIVSGRAEPDLASFYRARSQIKPSSLDTALFAAIQKSAQQMWPQSTLLPTLLVAATDATPWRERGVPVYGIGPFPVDAEGPRRVHGNDERVAVTAVHQGAEFVYRILREVSASPAAGAAR